MKIIYKFCKESARLIWKTFFGYEIINQERLFGAKGILLAANHVSWFDPPILGAVIPFEIAFLAKAELFKNKAFGLLLQQLNVIPIVRKSTDIKAINRVLQVLESGKSILLFPQGTRSGKGIKPGVGMFAIKTRKDILPIYVENSTSLKSCFLSRKRKIKIYVGERITTDVFGEWEQKKDSYQRLADYTFEKIMELKK
ncbi:MAG: 1-acyl-sn-glycerol-3-phosphate acyltransferase [Candidatus Cloacimonetes bacterium]|nr:1-acyl-sn-glycerol-3-phosphate acyltransferase [Candidatus Cloacimonadota bacterium]